MAWETEINELTFRRGQAEGMGGAEAVGKQHQRGRLTVRERIAGLVDEGSFQEVGKLAGQGNYENGRVTTVTPAPYVMGIAKIDGRPVAVGGEDFTIRGGTSWGTSRRKGGQGGFIEDLASHYRLPLINLVDGSGGSVTSIKRRGYTTFPGVHGFERSAELLAQVPVVSAVLGTAAGGPAGRAILSHWSLMVKETSHIFAAGPPVVVRALGEDLSKEELGGTRIAVEQGGTIDNWVESEQQCFAMIRRFLSYMPQNVWELPPVVPCDDPPERREEDLLTIVPEERRKPYDMRRLVGMIVDRDSMLEIQPTFGRSVITTLARLNGHSVGIIANNPMIYGGAMDADSSNKQTHFMELCDCFHIPIVFLVDIPGFMVGSRAEAQGTLRAGMRCLYMGLQASVPMFTVVVRKCYGMAGMAATDKGGIDFKIAWPSAELGTLPVEGGVAAAYRYEIENASDPELREKEIEQELRAYGSPFRTAEAFMVEDIIDPRETRLYLCRFIEAAQGRLKTGVGVKHKAGVRP